MSLDTKIMEKLDAWAREAIHDKVLDNRVLNYINEIPIPKYKPQLRTEYVKYYFKAKQEAREEM